MFLTWLKTSVRLLWNIFILKISILVILQLKIWINTKNKEFCSKLYKKKRKKFYSQSDIKNITHNKSFWETKKPFLIEKCAYAYIICLVHSDNVISDDQELADTFNNFFEHAVDNLVNSVDEFLSPYFVDIEKDLILNTAYCL